MKLYELTETYNELMDLIGNPDVPQKVIDKALEDINDKLDTKMENIAKVIRSNQLKAKSYKEEENRISNKRKTIERNNRHLKSYIEDCMTRTGKKNMDTGTFTFRIQKNPSSVVIDSEESIEDKYICLRKEINKSLIKDDLKSGKEIPGVRLVQTESLRIK